MIVLFSFFGFEVKKISIEKSYFLKIYLDIFY